MNHCEMRAGQASVRCWRTVLAMLACCCAMGAFAQTPARTPAAAASQSGPTLLTNVWLGAWQPAESSLQGTRIDRVTIANQAGTTRQTQPEPACELRYDGTTTIATLIGRVRELSDWQLRAEHWPKGTEPASLMGLRKEFEEAERLLQTIQPDVYRRVRPRGAACDTSDDVFYLLHNGERLFRLRFPAAGLGAEVSLFNRSKP